MKIIVAPDSFKGNLTSIEVADFIEAGILKANPSAQVIKIPIADGGEGSVEALISAAASGLHLVPEDKRNPLETSTYGVGQLILEALDKGIKRIIMCIGGSSTNDAGMGMMQALGAVFLDENLTPIRRGGGYLQAIKTIDLSHLDSRLNEVEFITACDVKNPLYGPSGAAGGLGGGLVAFLKAKLLPGIEVVMEAAEFNKKISDADLLITGEGRTDGQTAFGKVPVGLASVAKAFNVPVVCLSGGLGDDYEKIYDLGIDAAFSNINDAMPLKEAMEKSRVMLTQSAYSIIRLLMACRK